MLWKRITHAFLLGAGISMVGVGCSAVNALVSSSAGLGADGSSPQRLVAIGRVFENQGHINRATAMYRQAMKADPGNSIAQERLQFIAGINSGKTFTPSERRSHQALAMADSIQKRAKRTTRQATETRSGLKAALANDSLMASLRPSTGSSGRPAVNASSSTTQAVQQVAGLEQAADNEIITAFADDAGWVNVVDTGWELAEMVDTASSEPSIQPSRAVATDEHSSGIQIVALELDDSSVSGQVSVASEWKASRRSPVSLDEVASYMGAPDSNVELLLRALAHGEDEGVKALAATLLAECSANDVAINSALRDATAESSELIRLAAGDALIQRNAITDDGVDQLLSLLVSSNPEIRIQAAASLRNCAHTQWGLRCVEGLSQLLSQPNADVVVVAASTLGDFGELATAHVDKLQQLSTSDNELVVEAALNALSRIQLQSTDQLGGLHPVNTNVSGLYLLDVE